MVIHMNTHIHEEKQFECYICMQRFKKLANMKAHFTYKHRLSNATTFKCRYCDKIYLNSQTLKCHIKIVSYLINLVAFHYQTFIRDFLKKLVVRFSNK